MSLFSLPVSERIGTLVELLSASDPLFYWTYTPEGMLMETSCSTLLLDKIFRFNGGLDKIIDYAASHPGAEAINLDTGSGVSVLELVHAFTRATGREVPYVIGPRRDVDLPMVWADAGKAKALLGWTAEKTLEDMCRDTYRFQKNNPRGYRA